MEVEYYGFSDRPFQLTPDPRFYFDSATHRKAMTYLGYGLAQAEGFIVITGDVGTGKTTLVARLMETIDPTRLTVVNIMSTQIDGADLLRVTASSLGLDPEGISKGQLLTRIEKFLHDQARAGKRTLLIVDEGQNLPVETLEELRMLSNFQQGGQALVQILLLGQPEFRDALAGPGLEQLRQRVIASHHLTPMTAAETGPYIFHRLTCVGWKGRPLFSDAALAALHARSGGVPRRLNVLTSRVLLQGAVDGLDLIDAPTVEQVASELAMEVIQPAAPIVVLPTAAAARAEALIEYEVAAPTPAPLPKASDPVATSDVEPVTAAEYDAQIAALQARLDEQEAILRRTLSLLVDWIEGDQPKPQNLFGKQDAA